MTDLNRDTIFNQLSSDNQFPINFDEAYVWLGYSQKGHAKNGLLRAGFTEEIDYQVSQTRELRPQGGFSNLEYIYLTLDCFKTWCLLAPTEKGKEVRKYFLEVEKEYRKLALEANLVPLVSPIDNWRVARLDAKSVHVAFQRACVSSHYSAKDVHNLITKLVTGYTAIEARELPVVEGREEVALNHQPSPEQLLTIARVKLAFSAMNKEGEPWKDRVYRAVFKVCPD